MNNFENISIGGRYAYAYRCLLSLISYQGLEKHSDEIDVLLREFTYSSELDVWQDKVDEILPSNIFDERFDISDFEIRTLAEINQLKAFYEKQGDDYIFILENLLWIGLSNLYGGYNSRFSMAHLDEVLNKMKLLDIELPDLNDISSLDVKKYNGWGDSFELNEKGEIVRFIDRR